MTLERAKTPESTAVAIGGAKRDTRFFALIPCAGQGSRAGTAIAKQYQPLGGQAMVWHTVQAFRALAATSHGALSGVWVVVSPEDDGFEPAFPDFNHDGEVLLRAGGDTRAATVRNGLKAILSRGPAFASADDWVLVHDAARCLITPAQIVRLIEACQGDEVGGLLALPVPDTLKSSGTGRVDATVERAGKWLAQTPQMFRLGALLDALETSAGTVTDESSAIEAAGRSPRLVPGSAQNFKVTYAEDFALAEAILQSRRGQPGATLNNLPSNVLPLHPLKVAS